MKSALVLIFVFCSVYGRKNYPPIDKNANLAFINMEGGGGARPNKQGTTTLPPPTVKPTVHTPRAPAVTPQYTQQVSNTPTSTPKVVKPQVPNQIKPVPVNPAPVVNPITTPGPGSVKQLVNFYDSQGKASPIRPYSYSQAVKQG